MRPRPPVRPPGQRRAQRDLTCPECGEPHQADAYAVDGTVTWVMTCTATRREVLVDDPDGGEQAPAGSLGADDELARAKKAAIAALRRKALQSIHGSALRYHLAQREREQRTNAIDQLLDRIDALAATASSAAPLPQPESTDDEPN